MTAALPAALRACADLFYPAEAGVELLISHDVFLRRRDFPGFTRTATSITTGAELAQIDWPAVISALATGKLPASGGEQRMLRLAASIAGGIPVSLCHTLTGIDDSNPKLLAIAIRHASGQRPPPP